MTVSTIKNGAMRIDVQAYAGGRFGFDWKPEKRGRKRIRARSKEAAEAKARQLLGVAKAGKLDVLQFSPDRVAAFLRWEATQQHSRPISDVVEAFIASKAGKGYSRGHLAALEELRDFAELFPMRLNELDRGAVEKWLNGLPIAPATYNHKLKRIKTLFRFSRANGMFGAQIHPVENIELRMKKHRRECYSPAEIKALLAVSRRRELIFVVLGAFCGLRPEEVRADPGEGKPSIAWEHFLWRRGKLDVPPEVSKDRRRRFVPLCEAAVAFLVPLCAKGECVPRCEPGSIRTYLRNRKAVKWIHDGLRHSYASYRLALTNDCPALAEEMGNSVRIIKEHYLERRHEDEATAYFAIRPADLGTTWHQITNEEASNRE